MSNTRQPVLEESDFRNMFGENHESGVDDEVDYVDKEYSPKEQEDHNKLNSLDSETDVADENDNKDKSKDNTESKADSTKNKDQKSKQVKQNDNASQSDTESQSDGEAQEDLDNNTIAFNNGQIREYEFKMVPLKDLHVDPDYVRVVESDEIKESINAGITQHKGLAEEHAILVFKKDDHYQIIDGNLRYKVAQKHNIPDIPALVIEIDDDELIDVQITRNLQHPFSNLEIGLKILAYKDNSDINNEEDKEKKTLYKTFAQKFGKSPALISHATGAATVYSHLINNLEEKDKIESTKKFLMNKTEHLYHIKKSNKLWWTALVQCLYEEKWSASITKKIVEKVDTNVDPESLSADKKFQMIKELSRECAVNWRMRFNELFKGFQPNKDERMMALINTIQDTIVKVNKEELDDSDFQNAIQELIDQCKGLLKKKAA